VQFRQEKAKKMWLAQGMHKELEAFDKKQQALDQLLKELEEAKQEGRFWSTFQINGLTD
jgi:hypothetical protein